MIPVARSFLPSSASVTLHVPVKPRNNKHAVVVPHGSCLVMAGSTVVVVPSPTNSENPTDHKSPSTPGVVPTSIRKPKTNLTSTTTSVGTVGTASHRQTPL